jgi:protein Tex
MSKEIITQAVVWATQKTGLNANRVMNVINLLIKEECTIPFIARYRKEVTGEMDEVQIRAVQDNYENYIELEKRKSYILAEIKKQENLTPELERKILACEQLNILEDIYAPYKSKRKTKAQTAKEFGLEPLSKLLLASTDTLDAIKASFGEEYLKLSNGKVKDFEAALAGACDILVETFSHNIEIKEKLRDSFWRDGKIVASKRKGAEEVTDYDKFQDFFEYDEPVKDLKNSKASHRFLAMRRAMTLKILKVEVLGDSEQGYGLIEKEYFSNAQSLSQVELLRKCAKKAFDNVINPSLDLELKTELKKIADEAAIEVFGVNLKNLLLQPYLGSKAVLGIDPGIRTGCKVVIVDDTGAYQGDHVIYPFAPKHDVTGAITILSKMIDLFKIEYIAIGNGTGGRETLQLCNQIKAVKDGRVKATVISEAGASIYSASEIARKEFPDQDITVRGAVSIARRFQDPLAELVKIDPKSIGVGQYQHDVNQIKLKKSLGAVVEDCVNFVGVDLNTASAPLLSYVSGIGPTAAANLVSYRSKNGKFSTRGELSKVARFTKKSFEQSAGFLRIYDGENPLDSTFIHPERYSTLEKWAKDSGHSLKNLIGDKELIQKLATDNKLRQEIGDITLVDIVKSLQAPCQDPRKEFKPIEFSKELNDIKDVKIGAWYTGIITNITNFGAFVDIGIKENGLLHISQISHDFVDNALEKLKVGQEVKAKVLEIDMSRKRISLSMKSDAKATYTGGSKSKDKPQKSMKNNAFSGLKNFQLK